MPSTGFYLFLRGALAAVTVPAVVCQCPQRASTYFFCRWISEDDHTGKVSMPSTGFYLFLQKDLTIAKQKVNNVSMPSTGFYLFLQKILQTKQQLKTVSMPSTGFYLFLPEARNAAEGKLCGVNALNGLLLISSRKCETNLWWDICVNALNGLLLISSALQKIFMGGDHVCQCPQRASTYFFSTLPEPLILLSSGEVFCK